VEIIEHEHERSGGRQEPEQLADSAVGSVALVLQWRRSVAEVLGHRRQDMGQLNAQILVQGCEQAWVEPLDVRIECVHEHPEGQVALLLRCPARQNEQTPVIRAASQLRKQTGLPDPWFPSNFYSDGTSFPAEPHDRVIEPPELLSAPGHLLGKHRHVASMQ